MAGEYAETGQCKNCLSDMNRAKDSTCIESFKMGQGLLKSISERCDTEKPLRTSRITEKWSWPEVQTQEYVRERKTIDLHRGKRHRHEICIKLYEKFALIESELFSPYQFPEWNPASEF